MKVLVIGSGGREHALCWSINKSKHLTKLYALPGNAGMANISESVDLDVLDFQNIKNFCQEKEIDLVIVGPELPLAHGITEFLEQDDINVLGCDSYCANLESSKAFTKDLCDRANIKTAAYEVFNDASSAINYLEKQNKFPQVIKADGLAAGKGVIIAKDLDEAKEAVNDIFTGKFGKMDKLVIEEFLTGIEASFFAISDGKTFKSLSHAGDHKRIGDNDEGLNTGGMGTYSPSIMTEAQEQKVIDEILEPTFEQLKKDGHPFKGIIFAGLMLGDGGEINLIEYNIRFGDPEAQSILVRLKTDILEIFQAVIEGNLENQKVEFKDEKAITLVMAAKGYPESYKKGTVIENLDKFQNKENLEIFHAGTKREDGLIKANGGRVLNVTSNAKTFGEAFANIYEVADKIEWDDKYYRRDIAKKVLES